MICCGAPLRRCGARGRTPSSTIGSTWRSPRARMAFTCAPDRSALDAWPIVPSGFLIGQSVHSVEEASSASAGAADYLLFGHVFETASKPRPAGARPPATVPRRPGDVAAGAGAGRYLCRANSGGRRRGRGRICGHFDVHRIERAMTVPGEHSGDFGGRLRGLREKRGVTFVRSPRRRTSRCRSSTRSSAMTSPAYPAASFCARSFGRTAQEVGVDPEATVRDLIASFPEDAIGLPPASRIDYEKATTPGRGMRGAIMAVVILVILAVAGLIWLQARMGW